MVVFAQSIVARCSDKYEDIVGAASTGDAPTISEWSTILLHTKVQLILEVLWYPQNCSCGFPLVLLGLWLLWLLILFSDLAACRKWEHPFLIKKKKKTKDEIQEQIPVNSIPNRRATMSEGHMNTNNLLCLVEVSVTCLLELLYQYSRNPLWYDYRKISNIIRTNSQNLLITAHSLRQHCRTGSC